MQAANEIISVAEYIKISSRNFQKTNNLFLGSSISKNVLLERIKIKNILLRTQWFSRIVHLIYFLARTHPFIQEKQTLLERIFWAVHALADAFELFGEVLYMITTKLCFLTFSKMLRYFRKVVSYCGKLVEA